MIDGRRTKRGSLTAVLLLLLVSGCADDSSTTVNVSDPITTFGTAAPTTSSTLPPLTADVIELWGGAVVETVCVSSDQAYPQVPGYRYDVETLITRLLAPSRVTAVLTGQPCDATFQVSMHLEGRSAEYQNLGTLYTGMYRTFDATLSMGDFAPLTFHDETDLQPSSLATNLDPRTPADFLVHWEDVWTTISIKSLVALFGPGVAIELLPGADRRPAYSTLCEFGQFEPGSCPASDVNVWRAWYATWNAE